MKKNLLGGNYIPPQVQVLGILPESVLCESIETETGSDWSEGPDAEW